VLPWVKRPLLDADNLQRASEDFRVGDSGVLRIAAIAYDEAATRTCTPSTRAILFQSTPPAWACDAAPSGTPQTLF